MNEKHLNGKSKRRKTFRTFCQIREGQDVYNDTRKDGVKNERNQSESGFRGGVCRNLLCDGGGAHGQREKRLTRFRAFCQKEKS